MLSKKKKARYETPHIIDSNYMNYQKKTNVESQQISSCWGWKWVLTTHEQELHNGMFTKIIKVYTLEISRFYM